jgi:glycosyltransferase involved in cell wall biosynthesis
MSIDNITPIVLVYNEEKNILNCIEKLVSFKNVLVVDSGSEDNTLELIKGYDFITVVSQPFISHSSQWNFAINSNLVKTNWILALDCDYILNVDFMDELSRLDLHCEMKGYFVEFNYAIFGKSLRFNIYPPVVVLFDKRNAQYIQDGHTQRVIVDGKLGSLQSYITHDDRKSLSRWLNSQNSYAILEVEMLVSHEFNDMRIQDILRKMIIITPWLIPIYILFIRGGIFDGRRGLYYAMQRSLAEMILMIYLLEKKFNK